MAKKIKKSEVNYDEVLEPVENLSPPKALDMQVMDALGTPPEFMRCQVISVGDERYRVNVRVWVKSNDTVAVNRILHSYYLKTKDGRIVGGDEILPIYKCVEENHGKAS